MSSSVQPSPNGQVEICRGAGGTYSSSHTDYISGRASKLDKYRLRSTIGSFTTAIPDKFRLVRKCKPARDLTFKDACATGRGSLTRTDEWPEVMVGALAAPFTLLATLSTSSTAIALQR